LEDLPEWRPESIDQEGAQGEEVGEEETARREAEKRKKALEDVLSGKKQCVPAFLHADLLLMGRSLRIHKTPYMRVTLSRREIAELTANGATYVPLNLQYFSLSCCPMNLPSCASKQRFYAYFCCWEGTRSSVC
jgi:hypothetical protein